MNNILINTSKWAVRIIPALIMLQTLAFKFTGAPEAVMLFTKLGTETRGRILVGILELIAGISILIPKTSRYGSYLTIALMLGAIYFHIIILGYDELFIMAIITMICATINLIFFSKNKLKK